MHGRMPTRGSTSTPTVVTPIDQNFAVVVQTVSPFTYVAFAAPGSSQTATCWQALAVDASGSVTWANGNANFVNPANNLSSLSYS